MKELLRKDIPLGENGLRNCLIGGRDLNTQRMSVLFGQAEKSGTEAPPKSPCALSEDARDYVTAPARRGKEFYARGRKTRSLKEGKEGERRRSPKGDSPLGLAFQSKVKDRKRRAIRGCICSNA